MKRLMTALLCTALLLLLVVFCQAQDAEADFRPIVVQITARDPLTGETLYTRKAYVFFGPIDNPLYQYPLVNSTLVSIQRFERPAGERCNPEAQTIVETGNVYFDNCLKEAR